VVAAAIGVSTLAVVQVVRRLDLSTGVLRLESALAVALTLAMCAVLGGIVAWWGALEANAPGYVSSGAGLFGAPGNVSLAAAGSLMAMGLAVGLWGDTRVLRALRALEH
jgi:hypothetical protein